MRNRLLGFGPLAALLVMLAAACQSSPLSNDECSALARKYFELWGEEDPAMKGMSAAQVDKKKEEVAKTDSDMKQVVECKTEITRAEYACAIKATSKRAWNGCIQ